MGKQNDQEVLERIKVSILKAREKASLAGAHEPDPMRADAVQWPVQCTVGPGLEGAVACESKVGYVNGTKGWLLYRGYDIFDLCAHSNFEEVSYLLLHGQLPAREKYRAFQGKFRLFWHIPKTIRQITGLPLEEMTPMGALRLGTTIMRQNQTYRDEKAHDHETSALGTDEDSIAMESQPTGHEKAVYEFIKSHTPNPSLSTTDKNSSMEFDSCYHLIAGIPTLLAAIHRIRIGHMPIGPKADLSHSANFLYMLTGEIPDAVSERILDICLMLHADHGMNASTFASLVVASTLSDIYFSIGAGIGALNGPLHGGANQEVITMLRSIGGPEKVEEWFEKARAEKRKIPGFGHRVYKTYDPRALILEPLAEILSEKTDESRKLFATAKKLEGLVIRQWGEDKKIYPNVDFYSGLVYDSLGIPDTLFTPIFAVARMAGWTSRIMEYLERNRIFRPRAIYTGTFGEEWVPSEERK